MFVNARSAMMAVIERERPSRVWFPSYFCPSMLFAVESSAAKLCFYPVGAHLEMDPGFDVHSFREGDLVVVIDYFGFRPQGSEIQEWISRGVMVIQDRCQSLLSDYDGETGHFQLFSPRKFFGFPDGGILISNSISSPEFVSMPPPARDWLDQTLYALGLKSSFDIGKSSSREWFELLQHAEKNIPCGFFSMSDVSLRLLSANIGAKAAATRRKANFRVLAEKLEEYALFSNLPEGVVPLGFPVRVERRDKIQAGLFSKDIYPAIHWNLEGHCPAEYQHSLSLSKEIMTLPCDQRYGENDMLVLAGEFLNMAHGCQIP